MNITGFTDPEKQALLDLLLLGMYADGHLAATEDARIQQLLAAMTFASDHARNQFLDASITKLRHRDATSGSTQSCLAGLAKAFSTAETRRRAATALDDLLSCDDRITDQEREFLAMVKQVFQG